MRLPPPMLGVASFFIVIIIGAILLMLPVATVERVWSDPVDTLFTATSAVCVTGLIVVDTGSYWSLFGQIVILALIQMGGLGIMTFSAFVGLMLRQRLSFRSQAALGDMLEESGVSLIRVIRYIALLTFSVEAVGAAILFVSWRTHPTYAGSFWRALYSSIFHSISGFCNAGFSLFEDSLSRFTANMPVNIVMMLLIIIGGLGFPVIRNTITWAMGRDPDTDLKPKLSVQSRLVFLITAILVVSGSILIAALEYYNPDTLGELPGWQRIPAAIFQSVTTRTAGFNTVPINEVLPATALIMIIFMFVGASPGSTGGGIKTTTLGIMLASVLATIRGRRHVEMYSHTINPVAVSRAICIVFLATFTAVMGFFLLLLTERADFMDTAFEVFSAYGTVGLSRGLTPELTRWGRLIITVLMFAGRLGPLTLLLAIRGLEDRAEYKYPETKLMVG